MTRTRVEVQDELRDLEALLGTSTEGLEAELGFAFDLSYSALLERRQELLREIGESLRDEALRPISVDIEGGAIRAESPPSVSLVLDILSGLQDSLHKLGHSLAGLSSDRGPIPSEIKESTDLRLLAITTGSLHIALEGPRPEAQMGLFDDRELFERALHEVSQVVTWEGDLSRIRQWVAERGQRPVDGLKTFFAACAKTGGTASIRWRGKHDETAQIVRVTPGDAFALVGAFEHMDEQISRVLVQRGTIYEINLRQSTLSFQPEEGRGINARFEPEMKGRLKRLLEDVVTVRFLVSEVPTVGHGPRVTWRVDGVLEAENEDSGLQGIDG